MSKISKELIESYRKIVLPFVSNRLYEANFDGQGEKDKTEFEQDFNEILNLAISALNPSGDCISREALKKAVENLVVGGVDGLEHYYKNGSKSDENSWIGGIYDAWELINNAPPVPQVTVFAENADENAVADLKAELQSIIEARPNEQIAWEQGYEAGLAQAVEITEEQAINKLHETGWLIGHDKEMTDRPKGEWRDNLIEVFRQSAEVGGDTFHLFEIERIINGEPI